MSATIDETTHRIDGSRTTVYHVMDYYLAHSPIDEIAHELRLTVEQVQAAFVFIESHLKVVQTNYQEMVDRCARGNSAELEAKFAKSRKKVLQMREELRARAQNSC